MTGNPPPAPHCLLMQLQAPPTASHIPALHFSISGEGGKATQTTEKPSPCGLFGVADLFANELGGSLGKKRACLVNPISLPQ